MELKAVKAMAQQDQHEATTAKRKVTSTRIQQATAEVIRKYDAKYSDPEVIHPRSLSWIKNPDQNKK